MTEVITVWVLVIVTCTGFVRDTMQNCREIIGAAERPYKNIDSCERDIVGPRVGHTRCMEMRIPKNVFNSWQQ
jgi:hypothetical protein